MLLLPVPWDEGMAGFRLGGGSSWDAAGAFGPSQPVPASLTMYSPGAGFQCLSLSVFFALPETKLAW